MTRWLLNKAMGFVLYRPKLASKCVQILSRVPLINEKLISFASKEGLITHDHGPVPRQAKEVHKKFKFDGLLQSVEDDHLIADAGDDHYMPKAVKPGGKNHEDKSPLEKWFY